MAWCSTVNQSFHHAESARALSAFINDHVDFLTAVLFLEDGTTCLNAMYRVALYLFGQLSHSRRPACEALTSLRCQRDCSTWFYFCGTRCHLAIDYVCCQGEASGIKIVCHRIASLHIRLAASALLHWSSSSKQWNRKTMKPKRRFRSCVFEKVAENGIWHLCSAWGRGDVILLFIFVQIWFDTCYK